MSILFHDMTFVFYYLQLARTFLLAKCSEKQYIRRAEEIAKREYEILSDIDETTALKIADTIKNKLIQEYITIYDKEYMMNFFLLNQVSNTIASFSYSFYVSPQCVFSLRNHLLAS